MIRFLRKEQKKSFTQKQYHQKKESVSGGLTAEQIPFFIGISFACRTHS